MFQMTIVFARVLEFVSDGLRRAAQVGVNYSRAAMNQANDSRYKAERAARQARMDRTAAARVALAQLEFSEAGDLSAITNKAWS